MLKRLINSKYGKSFRRSFLERIYNDIYTGKKVYCCNVKSWHSKFICWKDLKEVQENLNSYYLNFYIRDNYYYYCELCWFDKYWDRVAFLEECLQKF